MTARRYGLMPAALGIAVLLAACGGGDGGTTSSNSGGGGTPAPQSASLPVTVIDGAIQGALVCLDKNLNGVCDAGEPQGTTGADGKVTLTIDQGDLNKYPVLAMVPQGATDKDTGPVTLPFALKAPGDQPGVVSPITTLVQVTIENTGATTDDAAKAVQQQLGVNTSPFVDYTQGSSDDAKHLQRVAQLVASTLQQQLDALKPSEGTKDINGNSITHQDVQTAVAQAVLQALPQMLGALGDAANDGKSVSDIAKTLVNNIGVDPGSIGLAVAALHAPDAPDAGKPTAGGQLHTINYTDANNWSRRVLSASLDQATPKGGLTRFYDRRSRAASGVIANWSFSGDPTRQNDVHWDGQAWVQCKLLQESTSTVRDGQGRSSYSYCDGFEAGGSVRSVFDLNGKAMKDVYQQIIAGGYTNVQIANADTALGSATFPDGAKLYLQQNSALSTAIAYIPNVGQKVVDTQADVASGDGTACAKITATTPVASYSSVATTLDAMIAANRGTPCVFTANADSGPRNEWWSQSTVSIGQIGNAPTGGNPTSFYSGNTLLRVAFGPNQTTTYYSCQQRAVNASARNCDPIGTGTYAITQLGDARVLTFQGEPAQFSALSYQRAFAERGGAVYYGYHNRPVTTSQARLNLTAANALFTQLGMPTVDPESTPALTAASYQGNWILNGSGTPLDTFTGIDMHLSGNGGASTCTDNQTGQSAACTVSLDPATGAVTFSDADGNASGTFVFDTGAASGTFTPTGGTAQAFLGQRR